MYTSFYFPCYTINKHSKYTKIIEVLPTAINHRVGSREARYTRSCQGGGLHLKESSRIPLYSSIGIEQGHTDGCISHRVVLSALTHTNPNLGTMILREASIFPSGGIPDTEKSREVNDGMVIHTLSQLEPSHILQDALTNQNGIGRQV